MQYRQFGKLGWCPSALGFGAMRLPKKGNGQVDAAHVEAMLRTALEGGVNYIDTAYVYHDGQSEKVIGKILHDNHLRDQVNLASKMPPWQVKEPRDFERILDEQLARMQTDHLDFYLLHALGKKSWQDKVLRFDLLTRAEKALQAGKILHLGFSFHDEFEVFEEILNGYSRWEFCQIQYHYMGIEEQAGQRGLRSAAAHGLAVIVMEPLLGGRLACPPPDVAAVFAAADPRRTPVDWALQWLWNQPEVSLVLSGMSSLAQVQDNLIYAANSRIGLFDEKELGVFEHVREAFKRRAAIPCTACGYCMPCPQGVDIPNCFSYYNEGLIFGTPDPARRSYRWEVPEKARASHCIQCGICEEKCPQGIRISERMPEVSSQMDRPD